MCLAVHGNVARGSPLTLDSVVISVFAILILSTLGFLFKANHHELVGGDEDPEDGAAVAGTVFTAVFIYMVGPFPPRWKLY